MSLEVWAFSAGTLLAGQLGPVALAAHTIVLNLELGLDYTFPVLEQLYIALEWIHQGDGSYNFV